MLITANQLKNNFQELIRLLGLIIMVHTSYFWERHLSRLANSARILFNSKPEFLFNQEITRIPISVQSPMWDSMIRDLVNDSMKNVLPIALKERRSGEELAITTLVSGNLDKSSGNEDIDEERISKVLDVYVHVRVYVPFVFGIVENGAHLAVVGHRRDVANAKHSDWVR